MGKGNPNKDNVNNFVVRIYDPVAKTYKPVYQPPEATDKVEGIVYLSDEINSDSNAATGVVAATPAAVKAVNDSVSSKLSKTNNSAQTVASPVTFNGLVTANVKGALTGNASTASKLSSARKINIKSGTGATYSATFDGSNDATITISQLDASTLTTGTIPLKALPPTALERMVTVENQAARFKLTSDNVQEGDTVYQTDKKMMYFVVDASQLSNEKGYREYQAGTAAKLGSDNVGGPNNPVYLDHGVPIACGDISSNWEGV